MIPRAMQAFVDFYDGAFGCEGMSICVVWTGLIVLILFSVSLTLMAVAGVNPA